jgi:uncharacterized protein (DUF3820 family)
MPVEYDDLTPMPFGEHRGKPLQDVPAAYLHWYYTQRDPGRTNPSLIRYIEKNLEALKKEYPDGIWR